VLHGECDTRPRLPFQSPRRPLANTSDCFLTGARVHCVHVGRAAVLRSKEELASTRRQVYLMEESCADKTRQTADAQSGNDRPTDVLSLLTV